MINVRKKAYAKINWSLAITGKRQDGYHTLQSLMQQIDLADEIALSEWEKDICFRNGEKVDKDLSLDVWLLIKKRYNLPVSLRIDISKQIPVGGGLGGGSCDAAAVINLINDTLKLDLTLKQRQNLGLEIGADVPYCVTGGLALVEGIGDKITTLHGAEIELFLCGPGMPVSTVAVYQELDRLQSETSYIDLKNLQFALETGNLEMISNFWRNDLLTAAERINPSLIQIRQQFSAAGIPCMLSGSGGTIFALVDGNREKLTEMQNFLPWSTFARTLV